ncbi:MAG: DUF2235 domain-containing protein [Hyphomonadaceae bacterium]|nr:DUF2235 domain-containing protein [Hyphomonadaceae bacterium]
MKRIAIFCDGTWNDPNDPNPTNVYWLYESIAKQAADVTQHARYLSGVGVEENKLTGGVWGRGLNEKVLEAYDALSTHYEPGDEIYLFGFSRGAYTARSLCGLIRKCGVLKREHCGRMDEAMAIYRLRDATPDSSAAKEFRDKYAAAFVDEALITKQAPAVHEQPRMLRVAYLGVWDTVGALGVPERIPFSSVINRDFRFHDANLSKAVVRARHALAIDETRTVFAPAPWTEESVAAINALHGERRIEQVWFPGDHGSVGGGGLHRQLSDAALLWIAEGAERAGLVFDDAKGHLARAAANARPHEGPLRNSDRDNWIMKLRGQGPRKEGLPREAHDVSDGAVKRMRENRPYLNGVGREVQWRRETLAHVIRALAL